MGDGRDAKADVSYYDTRESGLPKISWKDRLSESWKKKMHKPKVTGLPPRLGFGVAALYTQNDCLTRSWRALMHSMQGATKQYIPHPPGIIDGKTMAAIPEPELALFRHKLPMHAFYDTVMLAKRWKGPAALAAGFVHRVCPRESLLEEAIAEAEKMARRLTRNRKAFRWQKEHIYGEHAAIQGVHGPAYMLRHPEQFAFGPGSPPTAPSAKL